MSDCIEAKRCYIVCPLNGINSLCLPSALAVPFFHVEVLTVSKCNSVVPYSLWDTLCAFKRKNVKMIAIMKVLCSEKLPRRHRNSL